MVTAANPDTPAMMISFPLAVIVQQFRRGRHAPLEHKAVRR
jgi:hypothetical protein